MKVERTMHGSSYRSAVTRGTPAEAAGQHSPTRHERESLQRIIRVYVDQTNPVPLPMEELRQHAQNLLRQHQIDETYLDYTAVLLNNESGVIFWRRFPMSGVC